VTQPSSKRTYLVTLFIAVACSSLAYSLAAIRLKRLERTTAREGDMTDAKVAAAKFALSLADHVHVPLESSIRGCAGDPRQSMLELGRAVPSVMVRKPLPHECSVMMHLVPTDGGKCPGDFDIRVGPARSEIRGGKGVLTDGRVIEMASFPCTELFDIQRVEVGPPGFRP